MSAKTERQMQNCLSRLGVPLRAHWVKDSSKSVHGEIKENKLLIYDENESEAWQTFTHELVEFKLQKLTKIYRAMINSLIDGYEKLTYQEKERFVDGLPVVFEAIQKARVELVEERTQH